MQLSKKTLEVLKNFCGYNRSLQFEQGNIIKTKDPDGVILATATIEQTIPESFAVHDLQRLLNVLGLFETPEVEFTRTMADVVVMNIGDGKANVRYASSDPMLCDVADYSKEYSVDNEVATFKITHSQITQLLKSASVLGAPDLSFISKAGKLVMVAHSIEKPSHDKFQVLIGDSDQEFQVNFDLNVWKFLPDDYTVSIDAEDRAKFVGSVVTYDMGCEVIVHG